MVYNDPLHVFKHFCPGSTHSVIKLAIFSNTQASIREAAKKSSSTNGQAIKRVGRMGVKGH